MFVYRLSKAAYATTREQILSGNGAKKIGGRWNDPGTPLLYTSGTPELALLEYLVHLSGASLDELPPLVLITLELPTGAAVEELTLHQLPSGWQLAEPGVARRGANEWLQERRTLILKVPSVVMPSSFNLLLNPLHQDLEKVEIAQMQPFQLDSRLFQKPTVAKPAIDLTGTLFRMSGFGME